jgi:large subunit ribosomal protein L5
MSEFGHHNPMQVPRITKVVLNISLGEAIGNPKAIESATKDLTVISGQKPIVTRARKSIASFKLRAGAPIGVAVTLRGRRMYHLLDRLFNAVLPRIRDFRGVPRDSFDTRGNYSLGLREQIVFPEIEYGQIDKIRGLQLTIVTTARGGGQEARRLLELMGMPFARQS